MCAWEMELKMLMHSSPIRISYIHQAGSAALIWASREGHFDVAKALLAAGADTEAKDKVGGVVGA